jgi:hypothetical protein
VIPLPRKDSPARRGPAIPKATSRQCGPTGTASLILDREVVDNAHFKPQAFPDVIKKLQRGQEPLCADPAAANTVMIGGAQERVHNLFDLGRRIDWIYGRSHGSSGSDVTRAWLAAR